MVSNAVNYHFYSTCRWALITLLALLSACSGDEQLFGDAAFIVKQDIQSIEVVSTNSVIGVDEQEQFQVLATVLNSEDKIDVTSRVEWITSDSLIASVSKKGLVTGIADGSVVISVTLGELAAQAPFTVSSAELVSISLSASADSIAVCTSSATVIAMGSYDDGTERTITSSVQFSSSDEENLLVSEAGVITALSSGAYEITASKDEIKSTAMPLTVSGTLTSITISPQDHTIRVGDTVNYVASGSYDDLSEEIITEIAQWQVSGTNADSTNIASISTSDGSKGRLEGEQEGTATVSASCGGQTANTIVSVLGEASVTSLSINNDDETVEVSLAGNSEITLQLSLTASFSDDSTDIDVTDKAAWSDQGDGIASVSNSTGSKGLVTAKSIGETTIEVIYGDQTEEITVLVTE